ncbi:MAG: TauD/TfdA family dioxygenase [Magnetovibrio sp.]|nr:TauD/TfdA family dioxygenase [Magnetovibrio sp.]
MPLDSLDLSSEASPMILDRQITDRRAWLAGDIDPKECLVGLDDAALEEIGALVETLHAAPLPRLMRAPDQFELRAWRRVMAAAKGRLTDGLGFAVVDALPMDDYDIEDMKTVFWIVGQLLGRTVAQKWDGTMLYDVTDTGQKYSYGVRGSYTSVELVFHTDNAFGAMPPDVVGLLCKYPAVTGGVSRFCSLYSVHNRMLADHPELLRRLYQPMHFDRQAEHAPGAPKTALAPFFSYDGERLTARANVSLVRKGYEVAELEMEPLLADALDAVEAVGNRPEMWLEQPIERGQLQYLNNVELGHYRSDFEDHEDPAKKRHLIRTWHRDRLGRNYDG